MSTLYTEQDKNIEKTWLLMAVFLAIIVGIGYFFSYYYNNSGILYFAIIFYIKATSSIYLGSFSLLTTDDIYIDFYYYN